jgi:hypothetical protein
VFEESSYIPGHECVESTIHDANQRLAGACAGSPQGTLHLKDQLLDWVEIERIGQQIANVKPHLSNSSCVPPSPLWGKRLSTMTTCPGRRVGIQACSTYASNTAAALLLLIRIKHDPIPSCVMLASRVAFLAAVTRHRTACPPALRRPSVQREE